MQCMHMERKTVLWGNNKCSEMEKKNIPAKKVYFVFSAGKLHVFRFGK